MDSKKHTYKLVAVGGTFDRFHHGHQELLGTAFAISDTVIIGITDQSMVAEKKFSGIIDSYTKRKQDVENFLKKHTYNKRSQIVMLRDALGPIKTDTTIQAVVVGPRVDKEVLDKIKKRIPIIQCKTILSIDGTYLSSTRIRQGEIDRSGNVYTLPSHDLRLPIALRNRLKKPLGTMVYDTGALETRYAPLIISVGDATTKRLVDDKIYVDLAIVDLRTRRKPSPYTLQELGILKETHTIIYVKNPAGTINRELFSAIHTCIHQLSKNRSHPRAIVVKGEEDLAVLPALFTAPLMSFVWYGQPKLSRTHTEGLVGVEITEKVKKTTAELLSMFKQA